MTGDGRLRRRRLGPASGGDRRPRRRARPDADGFVNFQWTHRQPSALDDHGGGGRPAPGFFNDPSETTCTYSTPDIARPISRCPASVRRTAASPEPSRSSRSSPATWSTGSRRSRTVELEKSTNGDDADVAPGPGPSRSARRWSGRTSVDEHRQRAADRHRRQRQPTGVTVTCPVTTLAAGRTRLICTGTGTAGRGPVREPRHGRPRPPARRGPTVTDDDPSHYFGVAAGHRHREGHQRRGRRPPARPVRPGRATTSTWTYVVTNTGNADLTGVTRDRRHRSGRSPVPRRRAAVDRRERDLHGADRRPPWPAVREPRGGRPPRARPVPSRMPTARTTSGPTRRSTSRSPPTVTTPTRPPARWWPSASTVAWTYVLTNTGNVPLLWSVSDDQVPGLACPRLAHPQPGHGR